MFMGIHNGLFSKRLSGSAGDLTFSSWKGKNVFKMKATQVRNPRSDAQMIQRARMKALSSLGSIAIKAIRLGFSKLASGKSEYNVFTSRNMSEVVGQPDLTSTITFPNLSFSSGNLESFQGLSAPTLAGDDITVNWTAPVPGSTDENDEAIVLAIRVNRAPIADTVDQLAKSAGTGTATIPDVQVGDQIHVYVFGRNPDTGDVSNTFYAGLVTA